MSGHWLDTIWYHSFTAFLRAFHRVYAPITAYGTERVPLEGKVLIVGNHQSLLDPFILAITCPRRLFYAAKQEIFDIPVVGPAARRYGMFAVDREHLDISAAKIALRVLKQGKALVILPEGTRSPYPEVLPFTAGFVKVALHSCAPVIPTAIVGSRHVWPKHSKLPRPGRIRVAYGEPMDLSQRAGSGITLDEQKALSNQVRAEVLSLAESIQESDGDRL